MRTALFWVIIQRVAVNSYRYFGTTYRSHLHEVRNLRFILRVPHFTLALLNSGSGFQTAFRTHATWPHHFGLAVATYSVDFETPSLSVTCVSVLSESLGQETA